MHNTLKICRNTQPIESFSSVFHIKHKSYNQDGTSTLEIKREMSWGIDEVDVTVPSGTVAYEMSDSGNTASVFYPTPKRGGV